MSTYTQHYSNFIGVDMSSDPRAVARNRLAYAVNMWRDYESEQGEAIETFPGFRRLINGLGVIHGLFAYRSKSGKEYLVVHANTKLYCFESEAVAAKDDEKLTESATLTNVTLEDSDSQGFIFNNNLYILDGKHFVVVSSVTDKNGAVSVTASEIDAYVPTTYYDGKPYEQRNMLIDEAYERIPDTEYYFGNTEAGTTINANWGYFVDFESEEKTYIIKGFQKDGGMSSLNMNVPNKNIILSDRAFEGSKELTKIDIRCFDSFILENQSLKDCENLETVTLFFDSENEDGVIFDIVGNAFEGCKNLKEIFLRSKSKLLLTWIGEDDTSQLVILSDQTTESKGEYGIPAGVKYTVKTFISSGSAEDIAPDDAFDTRVELSSLAVKVLSAKNEKLNKVIDTAYKNLPINVNGENVLSVKHVYFNKSDLEFGEYDNKQLSSVIVLLELHPIHFTAVENVKNFHDGNPDYKGTGVEAINGCTKSAVFDGRIFLTGNKDLPNTVFYSNRNLTGANDPTYWGAYNYFNDGDGNTPNVDLLSTPSMLMVLKNNTVQDGSVYYHVPAYNEDEYSRDLVPKIYPSTSGAAGIGSAGKTEPGTTACNFLDDPVFLSTRGLEAVGKQTVNLERTLTHRSSNIDRYLLTGDLSKASLAEWKGYLVICSNGSFYLADSRHLSQHDDGSYQYEWYFIDGLGCYEDYSGGYRYLDSWYAVDEEGNSLADCTLIDGRKLGGVYKLSDESHSGEFKGNASGITVITAIRSNGSEFYFYTDGEYALDPVDEERVGIGNFYPATKIIAIGERLFFGTVGGDVCVINTDKRGVSDDYDGDVGSNRISTRWYTFHGVSYPSICVTRLDDCSKKSLAKSTVPGTTVARFKMMPGSRVRANVSLNGRDFKKIGEAFASRYDAAALRFDNFSFTENEDAIVTLRELTRNWTDKQYSFVSDGFREPFGLYELSYLYNVKGKIRR